MAKLYFIAIFIVSGVFGHYAMERLPDRLSTLISRFGYDGISESDLPYMLTILLIIIVTTTLFVFGYYKF